MKKILLTVFIFTYAVSSFAQPNPFANNDQVTWLGIDFSHVKLIGEFAEFSGTGDKSMRQVRDQYFESWNMVVINEQEKYDFSEMVGGNEIYYDFQMIFDLNAKTDIEDIKVYNEPKYSKEDIVGFINVYDFEGKSGIGMTFVAEVLNKSKGRAVYHFVVLDMATKEILAYKPVTSKPRGFTLRNYWAGSIYHAMSIIGKDY